VSAFKQLGPLLVPAHYPDKIGLGCPKCDDHELVELTAAAGDVRSSETMRRFMQKHADCGKLEQLEEHGGRLGITGVIDPKPS